MTNTFNHIRRLAAVSILVALLLPSAQLGAVSGVGGRPANPDPDNPRTQSIFIMEIEAGESNSDAALVVNNTDERRTVLMYAVDGTVTNTGAYTCRQKQDAKVDMGKWIRLSRNEVTLDAGAQREVPFEVRLPDNVDVGEHNGCIVFETKGDEGVEASGNVRVVTRQALRVVATVPGDLRRELTIEDLSVEQANGEIAYNLSVKNTGNVSADIDAKVSLSTILGGEVYQNGGGFPVLADTVLDLRYVQDDPPFFGGWYWVDATVEYGANAGQFGTDDSGQRGTVSRDRELIFIAPTASGAAIISLAVAALVGFILQRLYIRRQYENLRKYGHKHTVKKGETIQSIASRYDMSWKKLASVNQIKAPYVLDPGSVLHVPAKKSSNKTTVNAKKS